MSIYYIEKNLSGFIGDDLASRIPNDLHTALRYEHDTLRLVVYTTRPDRRIQVLENAATLVFVHGYSPNVTLTNCMDVSQLSGSFNIVAIDKASNTFTFARDCSGGLDSFFFSTGNMVVITNNPLLLPRKGLDIDYSSVAQYLLHPTGLFPGNYFLRGIQRILPGTTMVIRPDLSTVRHESSTAEVTHTPQSFLSSFDTIVAQSLNSGVCDRWAIDLTGGYDSRLITAAALRNQVHFTSVVHGEDDGETRFVRKMAGRLGLRLETVSIADDVDRMLSEWRRFFFLSGGYYDLFETLKEGARLTKRQTFSLSKVGGGIGEVLRDKWYVDRWHRPRLHVRNFTELVAKKLLPCNEPFAFCAPDFVSSYVVPYGRALRFEAEQCLETHIDWDITQKLRL